MKKKFRKVVAVISATVMVLAMGVVSVNASDIQPRAMLCPNCGSAMTNVREVFQTRVIEVKCTHGYLHGTDSLTQRKYPRYTNLSYLSFERESFLYRVYYCINKMRWL